MTQEEKDLLLKDLCGRLPYGVKINTKDGDCDLTGFVCGKIYVKYPEAEIIVDRPLEDINPYLYPLSSMAEEQECEYNHLLMDVGMNLSEGIDDTYKQIDWLNAHHFDYRGLIENGLAIDATGLNIH